MNWIFYVLTAAAGAANPAQAGANAELKKRLHDALPATMFVYLIGLLGILVIWGFVRQPFPAGAKFALTPWWAWTGGLLSIGATLAGAVFAQRMGSGTFTGISLTASLIMSIVLDNFGWVGFKVHPATWPRMLGCGLMIVGLWLVAKL